MKRHSAIKRRIPLLSAITHKGEDRPAIKFKGKYLFNKLRIEDDVCGAIDKD